MKHIKWVLLLSLILIGCQQSNTTAIIRQPQKVIQNIAIYDYEHFKPFLNANNDTTYVVNFWATWCSPCVAELPHFEELYQKYKNKKVRFVFVSLDFEKKIEKKLLPFLQKNKLNGEVLVLSQKGMNEWIGKINPKWSGSIPATIIYNQTGSDFYEQSFDHEELEKVFKKRFNQ